MTKHHCVLLTGGTGYVGGRLIPLLEQRGYQLRCLGRRPEHLEARVQASTEIMQGDLLAPESLQKALRGVDTAFYLVHSMGTGQDFEKDDRQAAKHFAQAARETKVQRIIYLGGLGDADQNLSPHLRSRQEVGDVLRESGSQVIEFRASIIVGTRHLNCCCLVSQDIFNGDGLCRS